MAVILLYNNSWNNVFFLLIWSQTTVAATSHTQLCFPSIIRIASVKIKHQLSVSDIQHESIYVTFHQPVDLGEA